MPTKIDLTNWEIASSPCFRAPIEKSHVLEEKLKIDKETLKAIKTLMKVTHSFENPLRNGCLLFDYFESHDFVLVDQIHPLPQRYRWQLSSTTFKISSTDTLKESLKLKPEGKLFLKHCLKQIKSSNPQKLIHLSAVTLDENYVLFDYGQKQYDEGLKKCLKRIQFEELGCFELDKVEPLDDWFKAKPTHSPKQPLPDYNKNEPDFLVSDKIEQATETRNLPLWTLPEILPSDLLFSNMFSHDSEIYNFKYFLQVERIVDSTVSNSQNTLRLLETFPLWNLSRLQLACMSWSVFKNLSIEHLETKGSVVEDGTITDQSVAGHTSSATCFSKRENRVSVSNYESLAQASYNSLPSDEPEILQSQYSVSESMKTCIGPTIQEVTKTPEFPDSVFLRNTKRNSDNSEGSSLESLVKTLYKKRRTIPSAVIADANFPIDSVIQFNQYIPMPERILGKENLKEISTNTCDSISLPTDSFTIVGQRDIVMNMALYRKDRFLFDLFQELQKYGRLRISEVELPLAENDYDMFVSLTLGVVIVPLIQINQFDVFTGRRLAVEQLMKIAHQCKEIIVIVRRDQSEGNAQSVEDFAKVLELNKIQIMIVDSDEYLYKICEIINANAREVSNIVNECVQESLEELFLQECDISNPFLTKEILSRESLEKFITMGNEQRAERFNDIMTYELLVSLDKIFQQEFIGSQ